MPKLKAKQHILFESKLYAPGDVLPASNESMVEAWLEADTAAWFDEEQAAAPKAFSVTAQAGLPGKAEGSERSEDGDLVGRVPKTTRRKKQ